MLRRQAPPPSKGVRRNTPDSTILDSIGDFSLTLRRLLVPPKSVTSFPLLTPRLLESAIRFRSGNPPRNPPFGKPRANSVSARPYNQGLANGAANGRIARSRRRAYSPPTLLRSCPSCRLR